MSVTSRRAGVDGAQGADVGGVAVSSCVAEMSTSLEQEDYGRFGGAS